jgi:hypothetical protein
VAEVSARELLDLEAGALFTCDLNRRLLKVNEPWDGTAAAPRFFLGRTVDGNLLCRCRYDLSGALVDALEALARDEVPAVEIDETPRHAEEYLRLLPGGRVSQGPGFLVPPLRPSAFSAAGPGNFTLTALTRENIGDFSLPGFEWLRDEIDLVQPCAALVLRGRVVSQCRSVRISPRAHEAGLETLPDFRGRSCALPVTAAWAAAVRERGALPLYSTSRENAASRRVAGKLGLYFFGNTFSVS